MTADTVRGNGSAPAPLPSAESGRWQPIRGGLLNLYRYDYEEFRYEQGHLLLRGNNGTGKSRVLALQLPFLLDGEVAPHRLEPDGDPAKRIEWNLLLGKYDDRLGYTWLEFGRRDEAGARHYLTLGAGLRAVEGKGLAGRWFFVTAQRIGEELYLQTPSGQALTRERLEEAIGDRGRVFTTAAAYRTAVDQALFKLGTHRYEALVNLLIQLRQPQLSRLLDEKKLSAALSEALPPVSPAIVADVAESFRSLEADRAALDAFVAASRGVELFLAEYRRYAQIAARRRAEGVRQTHAAYEATMRRLRAAETERDEATAEIAAVAARIERLALDERAAAAAVETLMASPQMRDAQALDRARRDAVERDVEARSAATELTHAAEARRAREREREAAVAAAASSRGHLAAAAAGADERATAAGLEAAHRAAVAPLGLPDGAGDLALLDGVQRRVEQTVVDRLRAVAHVRRLSEAVRSADAALTLAKQAHTDLAAQVDDALASHQGAHEAVDRAGAALADAYRTWSASLAELEPAGIEEIADALADWCGTTDGTSPVATAVRVAVDAAVARLAGRRADLEGRLAATLETLTGLRDEEAQLAAGRYLPPPPPHTRDDSARAGRAGAPLWSLCDFRPDVDDAERAGLEAALEASGLLDAWVTPDGRLLPPGVHDTVVAPGTSPLPDEAAHLGTRLVAAIDRDDPRAASVSEATVTAVLRHVGARAGAGHVWVDADGRWQVGPLHGAWTKPAAAHIGQGAREAARRRRLAELAAEIARVEGEAATLRAALEAVAACERTVQAEAVAAPGDEAVRRAQADLAAAGRAVTGLRARLAEAEARVADRRRDLESAVEARAAAAADLGLGRWVADLRGLEEAVGSYRQAVAGLWPTIRAHVGARGRVVAAAAGAAEAAAVEQRRQAVLHEAEKKARAAAAERDTLQTSVGAAVGEILARLADARGKLAALQEEARQASDHRTKLGIREALARQKVETETTTLEADAQRRDAAIASLKTYAATRLLDVAGRDLDDAGAASWSVTRAVEVARRIEDALAGVASDDAAWQRTQRGIHQHVQTLTDTLLPHGYDPVTTIEDDIFVVTTPFRGRSCTMAELRDELSEEITTRQSLLDAREREVLENHLIGEVSTHLHERLHAAEALVREMNEELRTRPTSTGMTLRFTWEAIEEGTPGLAEARKRLLRAGGTWSPAERQALGAFLQQQIQAVRASRETGTWQEHLTAALDYRTWHQFFVERQQDGQWKRLTKRTHGTGSGGEKAIALTIPQFAAAAAHYRTGDPLAPRLILLDEAFVGIDKAMRAQCMGLLRAFDLDFVMTSEQEWGCYATLPGVAIYQLATRPGIDAVGLTRWVWNGRQRVRDDQRLPSPAPPGPGSGPDDGGLLPHDRNGERLV